jgi:HAD superfamily hydrolase (TIGR01549 family)
VTNRLDGNGKPVVRAVLFDLDDTLFDHRQCARLALRDLHESHAVFQTRSLSDFERLHAAFLEELHKRVIAGELPLEVAREERIRRLFAAVGATPDASTITQAAARYRDGYRIARQPIAGAAHLLAAVRQRARVGIVSNNLLEEQEDKLRHCELDRHVDVLVVSEKVGVSKPDPRIFEVALQRLECSRTEAVMIGDSWEADIAGARAAGIRAIWFNPLAKPSPDPDARVPEIRMLEPLDAAIAVIFHDSRQGSHATRDDTDAAPGP